MSMDYPAFLPDASMLQMQMLLDQHRQQTLNPPSQGTKRGLDGEDSDHSSHSSHHGLTRRGSLPPFKKRYLEVPQEQGRKESNASTSGNDQDNLSARFQAFAEAQRRSKVSRELLAKATQELQQANNRQKQQQQLMRLIALQNATKRSSSSSNAEQRKSSLGPTCGSRTGSLALGGGTDVFATRTGAAW